MNRNLLIVPAAATLLAVSGCSQENPFDSSGNILAGVKTAVRSHTYYSDEALKAGPMGFKLYLLTEDCPPGKRFTPGPQVSLECQVVKHEVKPDLYLESVQWQTIKWGNKDSDLNSEVVDHTYSRESYMTTVYHLGLVVRQCADSSTQCITDVVSVDPSSWLHADDGQTISFDGPAHKPIATDVAQIH